jgi:hypothetical protein
LYEGPRGNKTADLSYPGVFKASNRTTFREEGSNTMKVALVVPFVLIAVAPFIGRWRANVWLKRYEQRERSTELESTNTLAGTV